MRIAAENEKVEKRVEQKFHRESPNELWMGDITYLRKEGWLYWAVMLDAFSRKVIGWCFRVYA